MRPHESGKFVVLESEREARTVLPAIIRGYKERGVYDLTADESRQFRGYVNLISSKFKGEVHITSDEASMAAAQIYEGAEAALNSLSCIGGGLFQTAQSVAIMSRLKLAERLEECRSQAIET